MAQGRRPSGAFRLLSVAALGAAAYASFVILPEARGSEYVAPAAGEEAAEIVSVEPPAPAVTRVPTPDPVRAAYITACYAASPDLRANLVRLADETEVNALVIDVKDWSGTVSFEISDPGLAADFGHGDGCTVPDMREFLAELGEKGIYRIARVTVFQDPAYAKSHPDQAVQRADGSVWQDRKGIAFVDAGAKPYWEKVVALAEESYTIGFDEVNFDYVRYPTDGDVSAAVYPYSGARIKGDGENLKASVLREFFAYLDAELEDGAPVTSADFFGMTTNAADDMGIGQVLEDGLTYFDYLAPMVYPSHYPHSWNGYGNPNENPGGVVRDAMRFAVDRANAYAAATTTPEAIRAKVSPRQLRAWIQDFNYGGDYDAADVRAQIDGTIEAGAPGYMLWDPANRYTSYAAAYGG
jgi:hypothetical protein